MDEKQGITEVITRLQNHRYGLAGAIQAALAGGLTASQIADLTDLKTRDVSTLIASWDLIAR